MNTLPLPSQSYGIGEQDLAKQIDTDSSGGGPQHKCNSEEVKDFAAIESDNQLPPEEVGDKIDIVFDKSIIKEIMKLGDQQDFKKPGRPDRVTIIYQGFYNKSKRKVFDSTNGSAVEMQLGDKSYLEGFWRGIQHLKVGEKSRIRIKPKYGFNNPKGIQQIQVLKDNEQKREKLKKKIIYYEVELVSFKKRRDVTGDGRITKTYIQQGEPCSQPTECDQLYLDCKVFQKKSQEDDQDTTTLFKQKGWFLSMITNDLITKGISKIMTSLRKGEQSEFVIKPEYLKQDDPQLAEKFKADANKPLYLRILLVNVITCQDFYHDKTTFKRIFKKGRGSGMPYIQSTVKFRLKVKIEDKVVFNNLLPQSQKMIASLPGRQDHQTLQKLKQILGEDDQEEKKELTQQQKRKQYLKKINPPQDDQQVDQDQDYGMKIEQKFFSSTPSSPDQYLMQRLDKYEFPSLMISAIKSMKRGEISQYESDRYSKLSNNFQNDFLQLQQKVTKGDRVKITIELLDYSRNLPSMYRLTLAKKKQRIDYIKNTATKFFTHQNYKRACKLYQRINGYFNFGDISNNFQKEDQETEQYKTDMDNLLQLKKSCFMNVAICKWKLQQYESVVNICEQIIQSMDDKHIKAHYFLAKGLYHQQQYGKAVEAFKKLIELQPDQDDYKQELIKVQNAHKKELSEQKGFYSAMFK